MALVQWLSVAFAALETGGQLKISNSLGHLFYVTMLLRSHVALDKIYGFHSFSSAPALRME